METQQINEVVNTMPTSIAICLMILALFIGMFFHTRTQFQYLNLCESQVKLYQDELERQIASKSLSIVQVRLQNTELAKFTNVYECVEILKKHRPKSVILKDYLFFIHCK